MRSCLEMDKGADVHEQGRMLLKGRLELTVGYETRECEADAIFLIPRNAPHKVVAVGDSCLVQDVFKTVREDYADLFNNYNAAPAI